MVVIRRLFCCALAYLVTTAAYAGGLPPVFWVGAGPPCNFNTLQIAIGAVPDGAIIRIASNQDYDDTNIVISNKSVTLQGGYADCLGTPGALPVLVGSPISVTPVVRVESPINARDVTLRRLRLEGGRRSGLELAGHVALDLDRVVIDLNEAMAGGGINVSGVSAAVTQLDLRNSIVGNIAAQRALGNQAVTNGGGIHCRDARITLTGAAIGNNVSGLSGGGLYLDDCELRTGLSVAFAEPYGAITAVIANNVATSTGGGVYARAGSTLLFGPASGALSINGNAATDGAGAYLTGAGTRLDGEGVSIDGNHAQQRGGAAAIFDSANLTLRRTPIVERSAGPRVGRGVIEISYRCDLAFECNTVRANRAEAFTGGAFYVSAASLALGQTLLSDNFSGNGSAVLMVGSIARIENTLISGNDSSGGDVIRILDGSNLALNAATIAANATGPTVLQLFSSNGANNVYLNGSIIWQPGTLVLSATPADTMQSICMNAHETVSIDALDHDPGFVDAAAGNFRLLSSSANIDACTDPFATPAADILGQSRPVTLGAENGDGDFDRGAYELSDRIFADGFDTVPDF